MKHTGFVVNMALSVFLFTAHPILGQPQIDSGNKVLHPLHSVENREVMPGELIVKFHNIHEMPQTVLGVFERYGFKIVKRYVKRHLVLIKTSHDISLDRARADLEKAGVLYAEPNDIIHLADTPDELADTPDEAQAANDPLYPLQYGLKHIEADKAWAVTTGSRDILVAVTDTPAQWDHEDLIDNLWVNTPEDLNHNGRFDPEDLNGLDEDQNGYIDDVIGYNFAIDSPDVSTGGSTLHGTHVAGIIGASGNNGLGVSGVNWQVRLIYIPFIGGRTGSTLDAVEAIDYAVSAHVDVINASWRTSGLPQSLKEAFADAERAGIVVCAAAGNSMHNIDGKPIYPANYGFSNMIVVAATNETGHLAIYSNWGINSVHVAAPGSQYVSTVPPNSYFFLSGTSMATPVVSGSAALLRSIDPNLSPQEIKRILMESCIPERGLEQRVMCGGIINLDRATQCVLNQGACGN